MSDPASPTPPTRPTLLPDLTEGSPNPAPMPAPPEPVRHDPYAAIRIPNYRRFFVGNAFQLVGTQMAFFAARVELYQLTSSAAILGLIGLVQVIPIIALALPAGHFIDRHNRKHLVMGATALQCILFVALGFSSFFGERFGTAAGSVFLVHPHVAIMLLLFLINGAARGLNQPTRQSLLPMLVPTAQFPNAVAWNSSLFEISSITGPVIAGALLHYFGNEQIHTGIYAVIYWGQALCLAISFLNIARIRLDHKPKPFEAPTLKSMLAGIKFVYRHKVILAAITLDMFAVLLGGAITMLPVFAKQVLHIGMLELSILQASASVGSILMAVILAHRPPMQHAGRNLLWAVAGFGTAIIVFGLSQNYWLSLAALFFTGFFDCISVVIRHSLVQLNTPDEMRGRVSAVNSVFISSSNELGDTESGYTIHFATKLLGSTLWGPMVAVAAGGVGTLIVVAISAVTWPELRAVKRLDGPAGPG